MGKIQSQNSSIASTFTQVANHWQHVCNSKESKWPKEWPILYQCLQHVQWLICNLTHKTIIVKFHLDLTRTYVQF